jgi:hypothetical protein
VLRTRIPEGVEPGPGLVEMARACRPMFEVASEIRARLAVRNLGPNQRVDFTVVVDIHGISSGSLR